MHEPTSSASVDCTSGARNSAFNPRCVRCGAAVVERAAADRAPPSPRTSSGSEPIAVGAEIGGYRLEALLGSGALGRVFRARRTGDGHLAAVKVLHPHLLAHPDSRARFVREARALGLVTRERVGRILDVFEVGTCPALVLELFAGESLQALLARRGPLAPALARPLLRELTRALVALLEAGWVHRDVKPADVMVLDPDQPAPRDVRLLDFGWVKSIDPGATGNTAAGAFVGSVVYAAPEQLFGERVGPQADWWSLGVVAYELLSGRRPFRGDSRGAVTREILRGDLEALPVDAPLWAWVARLLEKDAADRPASWVDVLAGLDEGAPHAAAG